jgi:hypothetical protein
MTIMKFSLLLISYFFFQLSPSLSQSFDNLAGVTDFIGQVKSIKTTVYSAKLNFGDVDSDKLLFRINTKYSEKSEILELLVANGDDAYRIVYNTEGDLVSLYWDFSSKDQVPARYLHYDYENERLKQVMYYYKNRFVERSISRLDNVYTSAGGYALVEKINYVRDGEGNILREELQRDVSESQCELHSNPYAEYYNAFAKIQEWVKRSLGSVDNFWLGISDDYRRDEKNYYVAKVGQNTDGSISTAKYKTVAKARTYEFDNKGNWTKCTYSVLDNPKKIVKRSIEYY